MNFETFYEALKQLEKEEYQVRAEAAKICESVAWSLVDFLGSKISLFFHPPYRSVSEKCSAFEAITFEEKGKMKIGLTITIPVDNKSFLFPYKLCLWKGTTNWFITPFEEFEFEIDLDKNPKVYPDVAELILKSLLTKITDHFLLWIKGEKEDSKFDPSSFAEE